MPREKRTSLIAEGEGMAQDSLYYLLSAILLAVAFFSRFYDLGAKPPHHDESMFAFYASQFLKEGTYDYVPFICGPFPNHATALMYALFEVSTAVSRYLSAFLGVASIGLVLSLGPFLGRLGAFLAALFLTVSPTALYFNRFGREDTPFLFGVLMAVAFFLHYSRSRRPWLLWLSSLGAALAYCSDCLFFSAAIVLLPILVLRATVLPAPGARRDFRKGLPTAPSSGFIDWVVAVWVFFLTYVLLFSAFFHAGGEGTSIAKNLVQGISGNLDYWWLQLRNSPAYSPSYYYFLQLLAYEPLPLLTAVLAGFYYTKVERKGPPLFLHYWFWASFFLYLVTQEKMPWQTYHLALPALLLAGAFFGDLLTMEEKKDGLPWLKPLALGVLGLGLAFSLFTATRLCFKYPADPVESYVFVQSSPDCLEVERIIQDIGEKEGLGKDITLTIEDKCSWPFAWLLRDYPKRNHPTNITKADNAIIISAIESDGQAYPILDKAGYVNHKYKLRCWWVPSWFKKGYPPKTMDLSLFLDWFFGNFLPVGSHRDDMVGWGELLHWETKREVWSDLGSYNMRLWVRGDLAFKYGFKDDNRTDIPSDLPKK